jgi:integrase
LLLEGDVAAEDDPHNPSVAGSSPARPTSRDTAGTRLLDLRVTPVVTRVLLTCLFMTRAARPRSRHKRRWEARAEALGFELPPDAFVFSPEPDGSRFPVPDTMTQRYDRLAKRLGIASHLHTLRHYSATELIAAGTDIRTVAGRLGHGGGGATTLRVYAAWLSEADQRAAMALSGRMPARPTGPEVPPPAVSPSTPRPRRRPPAPRAAKDGARDWWKREIAAGRNPTGAEVARIAGVDASVGRRWRREWSSG